MSEEVEDAKPKLNLHIEYEKNQITVKVRVNMVMQKLFDAAEKKFGVQPGTLKFIYDGDRLQKEDTPAGRGMEDGDTIDALLAQVGGS